jgi:hypothetical protein
LFLERIFMIWVCRIKGNHQRLNHINTLVTKKVDKEDKKIDIGITRKGDSIISDIHGIRHQGTITHQDTIKDQLQQIDKATTMQGIKGNKVIKD